MPVIKPLRSLVLLAMFCSFIAKGQTADEVISDYFEASGGKAQMEAVQDISIVGTVWASQGDKTRQLIFTFLATKDGKFRMDLLSRNGQIISVQAFDGITAWTGTPSNPTEVTGNDRLNMIYNPMLSRFLDLKTYGLKLRFSSSFGKTNILYMEDVIGRKTLAEFDKESHMLVRESSNTLKGNRTVAEYSAFKTVNGIVMPGKVETRFDTDPDGDPSKFTLNDYLTMRYSNDTVIINSGQLTDDKFKMPGK